MKPADNPGSASDAAEGAARSAVPGARSLLLVLGMHRSGTSALAGVLQKLGVELGEELLPPTRDNPKGYFENAHVVAAHEALFSAMHRGWQDPRPLPEGWRNTLAADQAQQSLVECVRSMFAGGNTAISVKDPRTSRVVPLWRDVARAVGAEVGAMLMLRHPVEVAASLRRRDGLSSARSHLLWITYVLDAERGSRGTRRAFVSYEALLADWRGEMARLRQGPIGGMVPALDPMSARDIDMFLDASLRNHSSSGDAADPSPFEPLAVELYGLGLRCALDPSLDDAAAFDGIAQRLEPLVAHYLNAPLKLEEAAQLQRLDQARVDTSLQLAALRELWRPAFDFPSAGAGRLYYRGEGEDFAENRAVAAEPAIEGLRRTLRFELPAGAQVASLRVDPDSAPGVYGIESLLINGRALPDFRTRLGAVHEMELPLSRREDVLRFCALGEDPHFVIDASDAHGMRNAGRAVTVEVRFRVDTMLSEIDSHLSGHRRELEAHARDLDAQHARLHDIVSSARDTAELLTDRMRSLTEHEHQLASAIGMMVGEQERQLALAVETLIGKHQDQLASAVETLMRKHQDLLASAVGTLAGEQGQMHARMARMEVDAAALSGALDVVRTQQAELLAWARHRSPGYWWRKLLDLKAWHRRT